MARTRNKEALLEEIYRLMGRRDFREAGRLCEIVTSRYPEFAEGWVAAA